MITLNTNKGLIRIEVWDEIESRPGFVNLNPTEHKLDSIIGRYIFKDKIRCGLSNCHTPHAKGYIAATEDGHETNIGKDCGKTYFGVDFETLSRKFDRDITEAENREKLWNFSFQLEELESKINQLRESNRGANWVHKNTRPLVIPNKGCPEEIVRRISSMIKARINVLSTQREATEQEIERLETLENRKLQRPYYVDEPIAEIAGIQALYPKNDLRDLLISELETNIKIFKEKDIDTLNYEELRYWAKWIDSVDKTIDKANDVVSQGRKLLEAKNLEPFLSILTIPTDINLFRSYLKGLKSNS